jgi:hypothetical protein
MHKTKLRRLPVKSNKKQQIIMHTYRYRLQPYEGRESRYYCPHCDNRFKTFTRYIDVKTGEEVHPTVGKCSRLDKCAYHYTPKKYFEDNGGKDHSLWSMDHGRTQPLCKTLSTIPRQIKTMVHRPSTMDYSLIPQHLFKQGLRCYSNNNIIHYLVRMFGQKATEGLVSKYYIGTANHWTGATIFWQIDRQGKIRTGKIMLYNKQTGRRVKEPFSHVTWAHSLLNKSSRVVHGPSTMDHGQETSDYNLKQCLFGEHLLNLYPAATVALVESEKTALMASLFMPQYLWLATGSLGNFNMDMCRVLKGRTVILYPDVNACDKWVQKAAEINKHIIDINFITDTDIEEQATDSERQQGFDIADYLLMWSWREG